MLPYILFVIKALLNKIFSSKINSALYNYLSFPNMFMSDIKNENTFPCLKKMTI